MRTDAITQELRTALGADVVVRARRPGTYQVQVPAFLGDGDVATIFVRPRASLLEVTDLGHTRMRLSYARHLTEEHERELAHLADRHGFRVEEGLIVAQVHRDELFAAVLGLTQIQSEAEVAIVARSARRMRAETFHAVVRAALRDVFGDRCQLDYRHESDPDGLHALDALIHGPRSLGVYVVPNDIDAERAVSAKLYLDGYLTKERLRWAAIPLNIENLQSTKTKMRLMRNYLVPIPVYDEEAHLLEEKLSDLAV